MRCRTDQAPLATRHHHLEHRLHEPAYRHVLAHQDGRANPRSPSERGKERSMTPDKLTVVLPLSNPVRWNSRINHFRAVEDEMLDAGVKLTTVECEYGERPFQLEPRTGVNRVQVRAKTLCWNKENLINIGVQHSPDAQYLA